MNVINIDLGGQAIASGEEWGRTTYLSQVKPFIDLTRINLLSFDISTKILGISFVQGFMAEYDKDFARDEFHFLFNLDGQPKLVTRFLKAMNY